MKIGLKTVLQSAVAVSAFTLASMATATMPPPPQSAPAAPTAIQAAKPAPHTHAVSVSSRVNHLLSKMTQEEKMRIIFGYFGSGSIAGFTPPAEARPASAGYVPGVARLGIPPQWETDAGIGVASQRDVKEFKGNTALPAGLATTATWNPELAFQGGRMIGSEARDSGFNVMLAGGVNLARDARNGRNFEYGGEDPLLAGTMDGAQIAGIQSNHIIATMKHFAVNDQEYGRHFLNSIIDNKANHLSDLLAFEIALEVGKPGSVMCAYNKLNGTYACENDWLLNHVLKGEWHYPGYVMSDWGGVHSTVEAANAGLDQQSAGDTFDAKPFFTKPLAEAIKAKKVPQARLDDMARRILTSMVTHGLLDYPVKVTPIDLEKNGKISLADAEESIVLLKNEGKLLPLQNTAQKIAIIGSHADIGVLSGGGSAQVYPKGGAAIPGLGPKNFPGPLVYFPSSPMKELQKRLPNAQISYASGDDVAAAQALAAQSDVVMVFAHQWSAEAQDTSFTLTENQDELIKAVAAKNAKTIVVLENGEPVAMPWVAQTPAIVNAWYPGTSGGQAIAEILTGEVNPSGHLPISFPVSESQFPRPKMDGDPRSQDIPFDITYSEGAAVGYKWYDTQHSKPLFPFGYGLSYTQFATSGLQARAAHGHVTVRFTIKNTGDKAGMAVPQLYASPVSGGWEAPKRLIGWRKIALAAGQSAQVVLNIQPKILADYEHGWIIRGGKYQINLASSAENMESSTMVNLTTQRLTNWK
jgi:beta-glucosidase